MAVSFLDLARVHGDSKDELIKAAAEVIHSNNYILGSAVRRFEDSFAELLGAKYAVGVASGTDALLLTLHGLGIQAGDEVLCPVFTFVATADAIVRMGATPVFVEVDEDFNMDVEAARASLSENTRAILAVHLFGKVCNISALQQLCAEKEIYLVEDVAQATGAAADGRRAGTFGIAGCFSFYPTKNLGGFGDGGLVLTNNEELAQRLRLFRDHGRDETGVFQMIGYNSRLDSIQAAMLTVKLPGLDEDNEDRQANAGFYNSHIDGGVFRIPTCEEESAHVYNQYSICTPMRDQLRSFLTERQIGTAIYYARPLHLEPCFEYLGYVEGHFPRAEQAAKEILQLPIYPGLKQRELDEVAHAIDLFAKTYAAPAGS